MAKYNFEEAEKKWQEFWRREGVFKFDPESKKPVYSIDTPPPTVSGKLHMGHVFSYTQTEVMARFWRMAGFNVYYPFGMDDNGLPTERLVEQELGIKGSEMKRDEFIKKCLETVGIYHKKYRDLWQSLGLSVDWDLEYSTISPEVRKLTQLNFLDFFKRGLVYRKKSPSLWCWNCQTSVAQAEVDDLEKEGVFYDVAFKDNEGKKLIVATTRPELIGACVGMIVNPEDERYLKLIGQEVTTPLGVKVKVYADEKAKIDKGTGIVMCCTYGDETDLEWKNKFGLEEKIIIDKYGKFLDNCGIPEMVGQTITEGKKTAVEVLKDRGLIKKEVPLVHDVGCHERCGTPMEIINTDQWFVKVLDYKKEFLELGEKINWYPKSMKQRYVSWVENLKWDWCVSRDRFYGVAIPVYYCSKCQEIALPEAQELPVDPMSTVLNKKCDKCGNEGWIGENLVFDTWFTSGNTPEINTQLNWKNTGGRITIPMSLRPNAHDIIRTWDFYTIVIAYFKYGDIPWKDVAISGHILLRKGEKISKRTGGGALRPEEQIATHSADVIRYSMCGASLGVDAYYDEAEIENGKKLVNKLFNAANFAAMGFAGLSKPRLDLDKLEPTDKWLVAKTFEVAAEMKKSFEKYDYYHAREIFSTFFWATFCDNYLEIIKKRIYDLDEADPKRISVQLGLYFGLLNILKMASPFIPHLTEELYQTHFATTLPEPTVSIHLGQWPVMRPSIDQKDEKMVTEVFNIVGLVRSQKSKDGVSLAKEVETLTITHPTLTESELEPYLMDLLGATRAQVIKIVKGQETGVNLEYKETA